MDGIEDILVYSWNKDAANLAPALDAVMSSKAAAAIEDMTAQVAAQMFGQEYVSDQEQEPQTTEQASNLMIEYWRVVRFLKGTVQ